MTMIRRDSPFAIADELEAWAFQRGLGHWVVLCKGPVFCVLSVAPGDKLSAEHLKLIQELEILVKAELSGVVA